MIVLQIIENTVVFSSAVLWCKFLRPRQDFSLTTFWCSQKSKLDPHTSLFPAAITSVPLLFREP
jgi:hypothetical protein